MSMPLLLLLMSALAASFQNSGASPFTGTWVADLDTQAGLGKDIYLVTGGTYRCNSCTPRRRYPADGELHAISGDPDVSAESVTIKGPRTIVTRIIEPAMTRTTTMTVAPDGRTATYVSIDHRAGIKQPLKTVYLARRVLSGPRGSHLVSGTWQGIAYKSVPELIRTTELADTGRTFAYRVPIGVAYTAEFGGPPASLRGPGTKDMTVLVRRAGDREIIESRERAGKLVLERHFTLSNDGRKLTIASFYPDTGATFTITAHRKQ
jgi:hypothetical protein